MDPPGQGGPPGGRGGGGDRGSRRRRAPRRTAASGEFGGSCYDGSRANLRCWVAPRDRGEGDGGTGWTGEALVATSGAGEWRRPNLPEMGKTAFLRRLRASGAPEGWLEVA